MTAEPRDVEGRCGFTIIGRDGWEQPCERLATGWRWYQDCDHEDTLDVACDRHENEGGRRLAAADRENAELRGEVERLRAEASENCTGCERPTNSVDTFCFVCKLDELETTGVDLRDQLAAAQAQLVVAREVGDLNGQEADNLLARAEAAEARLEAVRAAVTRFPGLHLGDSGEMFAAVLAALSAAPQPEPGPESGCACGHTCDHGPHEQELDHDPEWTQAKADLGRSLAETFAEHTRARGQVPPASDEPARCVHGWTRRHVMVSSQSTSVAGLPDATTCPGPTAPTPTPECRHCNGSGNATTFDGDDLGVCTTCNGNGEVSS